ncbi:MAG: (d)CMP kinase [Candidatus Diapherotrites archaeon]|nr:(d)CMP kinase [Candidatus Diapherotrites archaeon]
MALPKGYKAPPHYTQRMLKERIARIKEREQKLRKRYEDKFRAIPKLRLVPAMEEIKRIVTQSQRPYIVAICGPSTSGKTSFAKRLARDLNAGLISTDSYYKTIDYVAKLPLYFDDVRSVDIRSIAEAMKEWKMGKSIIVPVHDPIKHENVGSKVVPHTGILILEGIVAFHPKLIKFADLKVYFESSPQKRLKRKYRRDVKERGRSIAYARDRFYSTVEESRLQYMEQQRHKANLIVLA